MSYKGLLNDEDLEAIRTDGRDHGVRGTRLKTSKNSLDSDEEEEADEDPKKYNVLDVEDLEGQEEATIDRDGEIQITPFNMKDELEEGHFDKAGTYVFHKEEDLVKDQWLDNIDWVKIKNISEDTKRKRSHSESSNADLPELDIAGHYKQMLEIIQPNETVQKALCRLGGGLMSRTASSRWKKKKASDINDGTTDDKDESTEKLYKLTSLANDIVQSGCMDIYQESYERLKFLVEKANAPENLSSSKFPITEDVDEASDMFGDNFDEKASGSSTNVKFSEESNGNSVAGSGDNEVMWDFKWEPTEDAPVYGPHRTSEMLRWVQEGYFADGVWVKEVGKPDSDFYSSKRIDFELYL